jgi:branched-chain amino acid transport system permease protein
VLNRQYTAVVIPVGINIILAVSLNITTGFLGELSLGHAGFMAIGAYAGAFITTMNPEMNGVLSMGIAMVCGGVIAAIFGVLIGMPVLRLRGDYLAIVTLAFGEIIRSVINSMDVLGGPAGIRKIPTYSNYTLVYVIVVVTILVAMHFKKSRHGRAIYAIKENYVAAEAMGIPVTKFKIMAFTMAAFFAGIAGVLHAHNARIIQPSYFDYNKSIDILVFVVLGGMGSIKGTVIATIILTVLPEMLRKVGEFRNLSYALALIIIMIANSSNLRDKLKGVHAELKAIRKGEN